jgi:hypothetical protein
MSTEIQEYLRGMGGWCHCNTLCKSVFHHPTLYTSIAESNGPQYCLQEEWKEPGQQLGKKFFLQKKALSHKYPACPLLIYAHTYTHQKRFQAFNTVNSKVSGWSPELDMTARRLVGCDGPPAIFGCITDGSLVVVADIPYTGDQSSILIILQEDIEAHTSIYDEIQYFSNYFEILNHHKHVRQEFPEGLYDVRDKSEVNTRFLREVVVRSVLFCSHTYSFYITNRQGNRQTKRAAPISRSPLAT